MACILHQLLLVVSAALQSVEHATEGATQLTRLVCPIHGHIHIEAAGRSHRGSYRGEAFEAAGHLAGHQPPQQQGENRDDDDGQQGAAQDLRGHLLALAQGSGEDHRTRSVLDGEHPVGLTVEVDVVAGLGGGFGRSSHSEISFAHG